MADNAAAADRPSWLKRAAGSAQNLAALVAVVVSCVNIWFIFIDRERQARREVYQQQIEMTKFYFERVANLEAEKWCVQAPLFAQASAIMAGLEPQVLRLRNAQAETERRAAMADGAPSPHAGLIARERGVEALAATIINVIDQRAVRSRDCDGEVGDVSLQAKVAGAGFSATSYAAQAVYAEMAAPAAAVAPAPPAPVVTPPAPPAPVATPTPAPDPAPTQPVPSVGPRVSVYIHYPEGSQARAIALRTRITQGLGEAYAAPSTEQVRQSPSRDQIRIYRDADEARARDLAQELGLDDVQIVNLSRSYRNLPANQMEVWLKRL